MYNVNGHNVRDILPEDIEVGVVLRFTNKDGSYWPFSDCVITNVEKDSFSLSRPHFRGIEEIKVSKDGYYFNNLKVVLSSLNKPYKIL